jgi:hypothetical protein
MSKPADFQPHLPHPDLGAFSAINHILLIPHLQNLGSGKIIPGWKC